jgi:hypothetical protein
MFQLAVICGDVFHCTLDHEASFFMRHKSLFWVTQSGSRSLGHAVWVTQSGSFYNAKHFGLAVSEVVLRKQTLTRIP